MCKKSSLPEEILFVRRNFESEKMVKHILNLTKEEKEDFLGSFENVFSDCDGMIFKISVFRVTFLWKHDTQ